MEGHTGSSDLEFNSEETLSLCDLPLHDDAVFDIQRTPDSPSNHPDCFEFAVVERDYEISADLEAFVFGGRTRAKFESPAPTRSADPFFSRSESFNGKRVVSRSTRSYNASSPSSLRSSRSGNCGPRHKVLFGLAKIPAEMELGDMRKRQSKRAPAPMIPAEADISGGAGGRKGGSSWSLVKSLKCRARLVGALTRASIGCMRLV